jgi:hypothetical protein
MTKVAIGVLGGTHGHLEAVIDYLIPLLRTSDCQWDTWRGRGYSAANAMVLTAIETKDPPDYLWLLDADMAYPKDSLNRLLKWRVDIVGPTYRRRYPELGFALVEYPLSSLVTPSIHSGAHSIHEWDAIPAGMMLIKMEVLRALKYPWFFDDPGARLEDFVTQDMNFCRSARKAGFKVWCDYTLSRQVVHLADGIPIPFDVGQPDSRRRDSHS